MKLYWRIKKNGKWTWTPATIVDNQLDEFVVVKHHLDVSVPEHVLTEEE